MTRVTATVRNENGIHCRPSAVIIKEAAALGASLGNFIPKEVEDALKKKLKKKA